MKKRIVVVKQEGVKDCGVASLLSIIRYYRGNINIEKLRELTYTSKAGTTAYHLIECAKKLGFNSKGIKCNSIMEIKSNVKIPFIAHVILNKSYKHYVVVYKIDYEKKLVTIMDPAFGVKKMSFKEFENIWSKVIISFTPIKKLPYYHDNKKIINLSISIIKSNKKIFLSVIMLSTFITIFSIINSYYFKIIVDNIVSSYHNLLLIASFFCTFIILKNVCSYLRNKLLIFLNQKIEFILTTESFNHIINLPYDYFKNKTTGDVLSRISDLNYIKEMIGKISQTLFVDSILFFVSSIILYSISDKLFFVTLIIFVLYSIIVIISSLNSKNNISKVQEKYSLVNTHLIESINGYESIKELNLQNNTVNKLESKYADYLNSSYRVNNLYNIQSLFKGLINEIGIIFVFFVGFLNVLNGNLSIGDVITYNSLLVYFLDPIKNVLDLEPLLKYASSSFNRINELFSIEDENLSIDYKYTGKKIKGNITFKNYSYLINDYKSILNNINLDIKQGEKIILTGPSGCGKSTLLKSLLRYFEIDRDKILIDDKDINDYNLKELRNNICYVSQNETLFTASIIDNVRVKNNIEYDKFLDLALYTELDKMCKGKDLGYDTLIEEDGFNISGGERSRIILCRALTSDANIYLFDEVLNELDVAMERRILQRLFYILNDKTIIVISHRLDNNDLYDKVIKMEDGTIKNILKEDYQHRGRINRYKRIQGIENS